MPLDAEALRGPRPRAGGSFRRWISRSAAARLAPEEEVLGDRHPGHQRQLLEDGADAEAPGARGPGCGHVLPVITTEPASGFRTSAEDLDHRALAGAVLADERVNLAEVAVNDASVQRLDAAERAGDRRLPRSPGARPVLHVSSLISGMCRSRSRLVVRRGGASGHQPSGDLLGKPDLQRPGQALPVSAALTQISTIAFGTGVGEVGEEAVGQVREDVHAELDGLLGHERERQPDVRPSACCFVSTCRATSSATSDVERRLAERHALDVAARCSPRRNRRKPFSASPPMTVGSGFAPASMNAFSTPSVPPATRRRRPSAATAAAPPCSAGRSRSPTCRCTWRRP